MSDNIIKIFSAIILAFVVFINSIGNFIGVGDIIPTQPEETTTSTSETTTAFDGDLPQTKEEIVAYFNTAINKAKSNSKSITSNYMKHAVAGEITGMPSALASIGQTVIEDNMGEDEGMKNVTWTLAADKNAFFPVENETWASKLTADDVKSATITENNGKYTIIITTRDDARSENHKHGEGHAPKAFNVVLPVLINENIPGIVKTMFGVKPASVAYPASTVKVTVDAATGNVISANYLLYWTMYLPLNGTDVILPFLTENDYTINW